MADYLKTIDPGNYYCEDILSLDSSFESIYDVIHQNKIELGREEARAMLEHQIDTTDLIIHTENEIEGNENGRSENE